MTELLQLSALVAIFKINKGKAPDRREVPTSN